MVGGYVDLLDLLIARFAEGFDEGVVCRGEAIVGREDEDWAGGQVGGEADEVPFGSVGDELVGERLGGGAGEGRHAFRGQMSGEAFDGCVVLVGGEGLQAADAEVGCGDGGDGFDGGIVCAGLERHESAHAVAYEDDALWIRAKSGRICGIAEEGDGGVRVLDGVGEGKVAGRSPGAAVVEVKDVPAVAADGLGEVEITLVAREAVEKDDSGVWACSRGDIDEAVEERAVAGDLHGLHGGGVGFVGNRIGRDGGLRVERCCDRQKNGKEERDGSGFAHG